jgi:hypothetical protein
MQAVTNEEKSVVHYFATETQRRADADKRTRHRGACVEFINKRLEVWSEKESV